MKILEASIQGKEDIQSSAADTIKRIDLYKNLQNDRASIVDELDFITERFPKKLNLKLLSFENNELNMLVDVDSPIDFALLTANFLEGDTVKEVVLTNLLNSVR